MAILGSVPNVTVGQIFDSRWALHDADVHREKEGAKNPDFYIDGLRADLKVRQGLDLGREFLRRKSNTFQVSLGDELCIDIGSTIQNRAYDGIKQADMLFVDLDNRSLPFMVMWDSKSRIKGKIPEPKKPECITIPQLFQNYGVYLAEYHQD